MSDTDSRNLVVASTWIGLDGETRQVRYNPDKWGRDDNNFFDPDHVGDCELTSKLYAKQRRLTRTP